MVIIVRHKDVILFFLFLTFLPFDLYLDLEKRFCCFCLHLRLCSLFLMLRNVFPTQERKNFPHILGHFSDAMFKSYKHNL